MKKVLPVNLSVPLLAALLSCVSSCAGPREPVSFENLATETAAKPAKKPANETIRFFEERIRRDPDDYIAHNKLAGEYLRQMRETGDDEYLVMALQAAKTSLEILPAHQNKEGLAVLALVKHASHEFTEARDYAGKLTELEPNKGYAYQILGDALLELGEYEQAETAYRKMISFGGIQIFTRAAMQQRLARLAFLKGDSRGAKNHYSAALKLVLSMPDPPAQTAAYCSWQLGETAFSAGDYKTAERHYREALKIFPEYPDAIASIGKARAALGDWAGAVEFYERAVKRLPEMSFVAALGDLYTITGRFEEAKKQYELAERIGRSDSITGTLHSRDLAVFYADHDLNTDAAYRLAAKDYERRKDIYTADALAWTALKAGKIAEAREKAQESLRLGTADANLFYHAGMIAHAAGDTSGARKYLRRALALNPKFNLLQAEICRKTLESII